MRRGRSDGLGGGGGGGGEEEVNIRMKDHMIYLKTHPEEHMTIDQSAGHRSKLSGIVRPVLVVSLEPHMPWWYLLLMVVVVWKMLKKCMYIICCFFWASICPIFEV